MRGVLPDQVRLAEADRAVAEQEVEHKRLSAVVADADQVRRALLFGRCRLHSAGWCAPRCVKFCSPLRSCAAAHGGCMRS